MSSKKAVLNIDLREKDYLTDKEVVMLKDFMGSEEGISFRLMGGMEAAAVIDALIKTIEKKGN